MQFMYTLRRSVPIQKDVPFYEDFAEVMRREMLHALALAVTKAMATQ
jgi:hypothetical protein